MVKHQAPIDRMAWYPGSVALPDDDTAIRIAAIGHVEALSRASSDGTLTASQIADGFECRGERLFLMTRAKGIFWPSRLRTGALSIATPVPRRGRTARYNDAEIGRDTPWFEYRYRGKDPAASDNVRLRQCFELKLPIIYFYGVAVARYRPLICTIAGDEPARLTFRIVPVAETDFTTSPVLRQAAVVRFEREYSIGTVRRRLHQDRFRAAVLDAYRDRCAICHLRRTVLLDAAHIVPDRDKLGEAKVPNGLALCKLHHAAFDSNLLGVTPDLEVRIAKDVLEERDGPMLEHGLRGFHGRPLEVPREPLDQPDRELLAMRFEEFRRVA